MSVAQPLASLLRGFASNTQCRDRSRLEPGEPDLCATLFAKPVITAIDAGERRFYFGEQLPFPVANAQQKVTLRFKRRPVSWICHLFRIFVVHRAQRTLGFVKKIAPAAFEEGAEEVDVPFPHNTR
jgi:hypothetical protein